jgi:hypothetical protein
MLHFLAGKWGVATLLSIFGILVWFSLPPSFYSRNGYISHLETLGYANQTSSNATASEQLALEEYLASDTDDQWDDDDAAPRMVRDIYNATLGVNGPLIRFSWRNADSGLLVTVSEDLRAIHAAATR